MALNQSRYVQYGCGWTAPREWRNFDSSPTLWFERVPLIGRLYTKNASRFPSNVEYGDIVKGLPTPPGSCKGVYCSHVLEHLALHDFRAALRNTWDMLAPQGTFRLVLPDLERLARRYVESSSGDAALQFMREAGLGLEKRERRIGGLTRLWLGNSQHLWMWDYKSLKRELEEARFSDIRRAQMGDSADPHFTLVEELQRWEGCLGVECRKQG